MRSLVVAGGLVISAALLAVMSVDRLGVLRGAPAAGTPATEGIAGYDHALRPSGELAAGLRSPASELGVRLETLNTLVFESLVHGPAKPITFSQNWLAWGLGWIASDFRQTQEPERVIRGGQGLCHDAVAVLIQLAEEQGLIGQMIDLDGHVVASFEEQGRHWMADPDYGFVLQGPVERLAQAEGLSEVREAVRNTGHSLAYADAYIAVLAATARHRVIPTARLSPRLALIEDILNVLAWLIPGALLLALGRMVRRDRSTGPTP